MAPHDPTFRHDRAEIAGPVCRTCGTAITLAAFMADEPCPPRAGAELTPERLRAWRDEAFAHHLHASAKRLIALIDEVTRLRARIAQLEPYGPDTHAGVWIDRETAQRIAEDGP